MRDFIRSCNVHCCPGTDQAVVAAVYNHGGPTAERPGAASVSNFSDSLALHRVVQTALAQCEYAPHFDYSGLKRSDWPAFQVSQTKTLKKFEADFIRLHVRGVNEKNLFYKIASPEIGAFGLHMTITVNPIGDDFGKAIQYIVERFLACRNC